MPTENHSADIRTAGNYFQRIHDEQEQAMTAVRAALADLAVTGKEFRTRVERLEAAQRAYFLPNISISKPPLANDVAELGALYDAFRAAADVFIGMLNQPRGEDSAVLHHWWTVMAGLADGAAEAVVAAEPTSRRDLTERARIMCSGMFADGAAPADVAAALCAVGSERPIPA